MIFDLIHQVKINIFNISKINSEVRGGRSPRIKRLSEYIGESYFDYLASLDDLVLIMDESHRYRASAGVRAINELKPVLGLELTATPFVETSRGPVQFKNVIYDYPLAKAMVDGFVKEPAVVTQKNFNPQQHSAEEIERIKLEDGVRLHENVKVELETHARQTGARVVKPFLLVIARDTAHAGQLRELIQSEEFFGGFQRCLYPAQKFQSDTERKLAVILDRDSQKWFRPVLSQFQIYYKSGIDHGEYQPDFVAETAENISLLETKARNDINIPEVQAKKESAVEWCRHATDHARRNGGKPWRYLLIPHDVVAENMSLSGLSSHFSVG